MKKTILIVVILLSVKCGYSQVNYSYYLDDTSEWRYHRYDFNIYTGENKDYYTTTYFDGNEVYNNITYYKQYSKELKVTYFNGSSTTTSQVTLYGPNLVREDSDGKFYLMDAQTNTEYCSFDNQLIVNALIGDQYPMTTNNCAVQSISNYQLGSLSLKKINGTISGPLAGSLEGVGTIGNFCSISYEGGGTTLNCYKKQNTEIQFGTIDCNLFPVANRTSLSITGDNLSGLSFKISPIPADEVLNITANQNIIISFISIYNSMGQLVLINKLNNRNIDVSSLKIGTYFVKIKTEIGTYQSKFIKI